MFLKAPGRPWRGDLEGRSSDFPENLCVNIGVDHTLSLESCAAPPEAVSTASPPSPQLLEQEERPSNRRARETCSIQTFQHAVSALRSSESSPVDSLRKKFRASEFTTILRRTIPGESPGHRPSSFCQLAKPTLVKLTLGIFPDFGPLSFVFLTIFTTRDSDFVSHAAMISKLSLP